MPMRIHHIRIPVDADNSVMVQLVRQLIGLDPLLDVADLVTSLCNGNQRFRRYARDNKASDKYTSFMMHLGKAKSALEEIMDGPDIKTDFAENQLVDQSDLDALENTKIDLEGQQAKAYADLSNFAFEGFDANQTEHRERVRKAIAELSMDAERARQKEGTPDILKALDQLVKWSPDEKETLSNSIGEAVQQLSTASQWHEEQKDDLRLRLKAVAAEHFEETGEPLCPLCGQSLAAGEHKPLVEKLRALKCDAEAAQTTLDDACRRIRDDLLKAATPVLPEKIREPNDYSVKEIVSANLRQRFIDTERVRDDLPGFKSASEAAVDRALQGAEDFKFGTEMDVPPEGDLKGEINRLIDHFQALVKAATNWSAKSQTYGDAWTNLLNEDDETSLAGVIAGIKTSVDAAQPYLNAATALGEAITFGSNYKAIIKRQQLRDALASDMRPLSKLRNLVNSEAATTINSLSVEAKRIHGLIYNQESLAYRGIEVQSGHAGKQSLAVYAQPSVPPLVDDEFPLWKVDAAVLANTSWMRGILWSFVFAIRARAIKTADYCPFPLMVLDEPQLTYDSRNRRGWVKFLSEAAEGSDSDLQCQLIVTTHDTEFANYFVAPDSISNAAIERGISADGNSQILSGNFAEVRFQRMKASGSDEFARDYIGAVRVLAETMLKYSLEEVRPGIVFDQSQTLGSVTQKIVKAGINQKEPPFTDPVFKKYLDVYEKHPALTHLISEPHHTNSSEITVREAEQIHDFWESELFDVLKAIWVEYRLNRKQIIGEAAAIRLPANLNHKPVYSNAAASVAPRLIGRVSAYSNGRMSLGAMSWSLHEGDSDGMKFSGLAAYRLEADTLAPTAKPGDTLLIRLGGSYRPPNLVIEDRGSSLAARRLIQDPDVPDLLVLSASSSNPRYTPRAVITRERGASRWKIVGTLFTAVNLRAGDQFATDTEAVACTTDDPAVTALLADTSLVEVDGDSAEPVALHKQYLLVKPKRTDLVQACHDLDGQPVVALDLNDQALFKRLRNVGAGEVALESLDAAGEGDLIMMSLMEGMPERETLFSIQQVVGVIFEPLGGEQ
ncbi:MAG: hypothetical protein IIC52_07005 [Proteobacteria bacterium]|nr:hypothetical protein [Pseudomonadota bacterium]